MIVVSGASGQVGGRVAGLLDRPHVRLGRNADRRADYADRAGMVRALEGGRTLFLVSGREDPDRVRAHRTAVDAAVETGIERIVYLSFAGAAPDCTFTFGRDHWHTEQYIRATGLRFTFLRDNFYLEMIPRLAGADGVIRGPGGDGRVAAVSYDDIAACAVAVLQGDGHDGVTYTLTGPEAFSLHEAARTLGLTYVPETVAEAYASRAHYGAPDFEMAGWVTSYEAIANGELAEVTGDVEALTGRRPRSLRDMIDAQTRPEGN